MAVIKLTPGHRSGRRKCHKREPAGGCGALGAIFARHRRRQGSPRVGEGAPRGIGVGASLAAGTPRGRPKMEMLQNGRGFRLWPAQGRRRESIRATLFGSQILPSERINFCPARASHLFALPSRARPSEGQATCPAATTTTKTTSGSARRRSDWRQLTRWDQSPGSDVA